MTAPPTLEQVVELLHRLGVDGENTRLHPLGRGHIHKTYLVECAQTCVVLQRLNRHMDAGDLFELLPGFHDLSARLEQLRLAAAAPAERRRAVDAEVEMCLEENNLSHEIAALQTGLPRRVCHNDTKINNLLFDVRDHRPRAVIDLDTSMTGYWMHDYGDLVRRENVLRPYLAR